MLKRLTGRWKNKSVTVQVLEPPRRADGDAHPS
jgi:hypothetical protein